MKIFRAALLLALVSCGVARADETPGPYYIPYKPSGIYALGETVGWNVTLPWSSPGARYVIRENNLRELGSGVIKAGTNLDMGADISGPRRRSQRRVSSRNLSVCGMQ